MLSTTLLCFLLVQAILLSSTVKIHERYIYYFDTHIMNYHCSSDHGSNTFPVLLIAFCTPPFALSTPPERQSTPSFTKATTEERVRCTTTGTGLPSLSVLATGGAYSSSSSRSFPFAVRVACALFFLLW